MVRSLLTVTLCLGAGCGPTHVAAPPQPNHAVASPASKPVSNGNSPRFLDITSQSGVHFTAVNGKTPRKYLVETMGSGGGFIDYDNDGYQDIILLDGKALPGSKPTPRTTLHLYHNNHDGTFTDVTRGSGLDRDTMYAMGVAVGDYDNDGRDDIYVSCALGPGHLFHNEGHGHFKDVTRHAGVANDGLWGTSCCWVDYDKDGYLDLFVCNYVVYRSLADDKPCFAASGMQNYCIPEAYSPSRCTLFHNNHDGTFTDVSQKAGIAQATCKGLAVTVLDYDGDGWPDIFVASDTVPSLLFHNERNGTFKEVGMLTGVATNESGQPHSGMGADATDADNSGKISLVVTNYTAMQVSYYRQSNEAFFEELNTHNGVGPPSRNYVGFGAVFFDYDNDTYKDLLIINGHVVDNIDKVQPGITYAQPPLLYHNEGNGSFTEVSAQAGAPFTIPIVGRTGARADLFNDGLEDILVTTNGGPASLWRNVTQTHNHWITFHLVGTRSNRDGIGALLKVHLPNKTLQDTCRSGSSYLAANDLRVHFGLGEATQADVEVDWPSGAVDRLRAVPADRIWTVREGSEKVQ